MTFRQYRPSPWLAPYVQCFWTLEGAALPEHAVYPDGCTELIVQFGECFEHRKSPESWSPQSDTLIAGQLLCPIELRCFGRVGSFGIRFHASAARHFLGTATIEATNQVQPYEARQLRERVGNSRTDEERILHAEEFLRSVYRIAPESVADAASTQIVNSGGCLTMGVLARRMGASPRTIQRAFHSEVGIGPKAFARIIRFQRALRLLQCGQSGAAVAVHCGYFDQAHMIRDLKELAGGSPGVAFLQDAATVPASQ